MSNDQLTLYQLALPTRIGTLNWEQQVTQTLLADITLFFNSTISGHSDDLHDTIDYAQLANEVRTWAEQHHHQLLERFCEQLAYYILHQYRVTRIKLCVHKQGVIPHGQGVSLTIERCIESN